MSWTSLGFDDLCVGAELNTRGRTLTEADLVCFSSLSGDWHPLHSDVTVAANGPFGERVAHGMLLLSYAVGLLPLDPSRVIALRGVRAVTFKRPAPIGTTMRVRATVAETRALDARTGIVEAALAIVTEHDMLLARGSLLLLWRRGAS